MYNVLNRKYINNVNYSKPFVIIPFNVATTIANKYRKHIVPLHCTCVFKNVGLF